MAFFFLCCRSPTSHCKSSFIFHSVDLDIILLLSETGKKKNICVSFQSAAHLRVLMRVFKVQSVTHGRHSSSC